MAKSALANGGNCSANAKAMVMAMAKSDALLMAFCMASEFNGFVRRIFLPFVRGNCVKIATANQNQRPDIRSHSPFLDGITTKV